MRKDASQKFIPSCPPGQQNFKIQTRRSRWAIKNLRKNRHWSFVSVSLGRTCNFNVIFPTQIHQMYCLKLQQQRGRKRHRRSSRIDITCNALVPARVRDDLTGIWKASQDILQSHSLHVYKPGQTQVLGLLDAVLTGDITGLSTRFKACRLSEQKRGHWALRLLGVLGGR